MLLEVMHMNSEVTWSCIISSVSSFNFLAQTLTGTEADAYRVNHFKIRKFESSCAYKSQWIQRYETHSSVSQSARKMLQSYLLLQFRYIWIARILWLFPMGILALKRAFSISFHYLISEPNGIFATINYTKRWRIQDQQQSFIGKQAALWESNCIFQTIHLHFL